MDTGFDVIFMLDGTVNRQIYGWFKNFAKNFANTMNIDSGEFRVGGMAFTRSPNMGFQLNDNGWQTDVVNALDNNLNSFNRPGGSPSFSQAMDTVRTRMFTRGNGDRPNAGNYMVIMTGNERGLSASRAQQAARRFQNTGGRIFTVGVNLRNTQNLDDITTKPLDAYQYLLGSEAEFRELPGIMEAIMSRSNYCRSLLL